MNPWKLIRVGVLWVTAALLTACNPTDAPLTGEPLPPSEPTPEEPVVPESPEEDPDGNEESGGEEQTALTLTLRVGERTFTATLEDNASARAFMALLPLTITMTELNGNEKFYYLSAHLPTASYRPGTIHNGDLMLYGSNCLVLFYATFSSSYSYTRLGRLEQPTELASVLGRGNVTVTFESHP